MRTYTACDSCATLLVWLPGHYRSRTLCDDCQRTAGDDYGTQLEQRMLAAICDGDDTEADRLAHLLDHLDDGPPRLLDAALIYASWGWPVFPLHPGTKKPAAQHGFKDATTDSKMIRWWWSRNPQANIGVPTGLRFDVLDIDTPHGISAWMHMQQSEHMLTAHGQAITWSCGFHMLLLPSGGGNMAQAAGLPGIDYRGNGGYIVVPPSVVTDSGTGSAGQYRWTVKPSPMLRAAHTAQAAA